MPELLRMPEVAANTTEAVIATWTVPAGGTFAAGDTLVTVETEKAIVDVPAEADGVVLRHLVAEGTEVGVGSPIALLAAVGEVVGDIDAALAGLGLSVVAAGGDVAVPSGDGRDHAAAPAAAVAADDAAGTTSATRGEAASPVVPAAIAPAPTPGGVRQFASPLARRLAREANVELHELAGTGPGGRIRRRDVEAALALRSGEGAPVALPPSARPGSPGPAVSAAADAAGYVDEPITRIRKATAARLVESKLTAPHFYLRGSARVDRLLELRAEVNAGGTIKASVNDLVVKAVARAHALVPAVNVTWNGDSIRRFTRVDVALAIATDAGLVTPVIRDVDRLSLRELVSATADLIARAKVRRLQQAELEGGTITVTNLGMYGTEDFAAIINPPQAAILAVGAARPEPIVVDGRLEVATVMHVTLSVDHRPVDGATAAEWMRVFLGLLESPTQILI